MNSSDRFIICKGIGWCNSFFLPMPSFAAISERKSVGTMRPTFAETVWKLDSGQNEMLTLAACINQVYLWWGLWLVCPDFWPLTMSATKVVIN